MIAAMGLTLNNSNMGRVYIQSMLIIYRKCFIPKLTYGLIGFHIREKEYESMELISRKVIKNFANLPQCTPKIALYNE